MQLTGQLLIGRSAVAGQNGTLHVIAAATGEQLEPRFGGASLHDLETACALADDAFDTYRETYRETTLDARAVFPDAIGRHITALGDDLIERFLRPVSYQNLTDALLPHALCNGNPLNVPQRIDGVPAPREAHHV